MMTITPEQRRQPSQVECEHCDGSGACPLCDGSGAGLGSRRCEMCIGLGVCLECGGDGYQERPHAC